MAKSVFNVRVYYEDTDFSGNVYHAAFVQFMERARTEYLRQLGIHHSELVRDGLFFVVRRLDVTYLAPAHIDDELVVVSHVKDLTGVRMVLEQSIFRVQDQITRGEVEVVLVGPDGKPKRLPTDIRLRMAGSGTHH
ncbi:MAG: YbgC/FadM family acyl-CoA thioesterase [Hyphomicrobiaceae bacterium]|nr:YbgC/FadM family acyl-CoA thioesterase [Hyphomicrobiaceae bacterium]